MSISRLDALRTIEAHCAELPVITTCGATSREYRLLVNRPGHLPVVDSMGLCPSIGTGLAMALAESRFAKVVVVEGDGGMLMNINALASAAALAPARLLLIVLDNGCYASTGGQRTLAQKLDLTEIARGFGVKALPVHDQAGLEGALAQVLGAPGPWFVHVRITPGNAPAPYVSDDPAVLAHQFHQYCTAE